jgi:hypothetical protein
MDDNSLVHEHDLGPLTVNQFGEKFFYNLSRHSFDKVSAQAQFESKFSDTLLREDALIIVVGTDSGLLLQYLQRQSLPKGSRYVFVEPDEVLHELYTREMLGENNERIAVVSLQDWPSALQAFKIADYFYIGGVSSLNAFCAEDDFINQYAELSWHIAEVLSQLNWQYSMELGTEAFIARQINNVVDNKLPAKLLEKTFLGKTAMLLAGGPSLDQALLWVKQHRGQLVVFAVSRISRQLLAAGIEPDFVFSVDPTDLSFDISKEMLKFGRKTIFVCSYHTVPTLLNQWQGTVLYLGPRLPWQSPLNVANLGSAGPTVTNTALHIAYDFGFRRLILAGVDLCFTREGFTHAAGSDEQLAGPRFNLTSLQVETNAGFMAPTSCDFAQAIKSLALQAKVLTTAGCNIINASAGAAKVENIDFVPLAEILLDAEPIDAWTLASAKLGTVHDDRRYFFNLSEELKRAQFQVKSIAKLAANARQINDAMYNSEDTIVNFKDKKQLDQIEKKLKRDHRHFSKLVKRFGIRSLIKLAKPFSDEEWTVEEARQLGNSYYDTYQEGAAKLLRLVEDAQQRLLARQQELAEKPNFDLLLTQGLKDGSFGRVKLWRQYTVDSELTPQVAKQFAEFEQRFEQVLNDKNTRHFARAKHHSHLPSVRQRAGLLFKHKKTEELRDLLSALDKHEQQQEAQPYRWLIDGYLAELADEPQSALDAYQHIVGDGTLLLEEALSRIAAIGIELDDAQTAGLALQCLSQLNPFYLPLHAELLRLRGEIMPAIDGYNSYIEQFPEDLLVQMKLATLYKDCQIYDAANMMLKCILQRKPDFTAAISLKLQLDELQASGL